MLAGRQDEREALSRLLKGLTDGTLGQTIHLLQAPRGMGKTVLLLDLVAQVPADVAVIHADAPSLPSLAEAARIVAPPLSWWRLILQWLSGVSMVGIRVERPAGSVDSDLRTFERALERRRERPLLLIIDEAHTLDDEVQEEARQQVDAVRAEFYTDRFDEFERDAVEAGIGRDAMLKAAQALAAAVRSPDDILTTGDLDRRLQDGGLDPAELVVGKRIIVENGFLTRSAGEWTAGISSLATYIGEHPRV